jgi:acetyl-CoA synthetase
VRWEVFDGNREQFNIAHECISRHASDEVAIRIKFDDRHREVYMFREFDRLVSQFANLLERLNLHQEDRIVLLLTDPIGLWALGLGFRMPNVVELKIQLTGMLLRFPHRTRSSVRQYP